VRREICWDIPRKLARVTLWKNMSSAAKASNAGKAILFAGLLCGILDGISAIILTAALGGTTVRMFQGIARGVLGQAAFQQGAS
jgi:hypothetical protein